MRWWRGSAGTERTVRRIEVPVTVQNMATKQAGQYTLMKNLQRKQLNPIDRTEESLRLLGQNIEIERSEVISLLNIMTNKKRGLTDNVVSNKEIVVEETLRTVGRRSPESCANPPLASPETPI